MTSREHRLKELEQLKHMSHEEVAQFWDTHDFTDYSEFLERAEIVGTPKRQKDTRSFRLDEEDIQKLRAIADGKGIGATTLVRMIIKEFLNNQGDISPV